MNVGSVRKLSGSIVLASVVGISTMALALRQVQWSELGHALANVSFEWLALAALAQFASYLLMTVRWRLLMPAGKRPGFGDAFDFLMIGAVASLVLPWKLNDVARAVGAGRYLGTSSSTLLGTIVVERLLDTFVLLAFGVALSFLMEVPPLLRSGLIMLSVGALSVSIALWLGPNGPLGLLSAWVVRLRGPASRALRPLADFIEGASIGRSWSSLFLAMTVATAVGMMSATSALCSVLAFRFPVPWFAGMFVTAVLNLGAVLPAPPAGIGVYHYLVTQSLSPWTSDSSAAFACALVMHALSIVVVLLIGSASLFRKGLSLGGLRRMAADINQEAP